MTTHDRLMGIECNRTPETDERKSSYVQSTLTSSFSPPLPMNDQDRVSASLSRVDLISLSLLDFRR